VVIGILDPNPGVCGKGVLRLQRAKIEVELFPHALAKEILDLNSEFIRAQQGFGIRIETPKRGAVLSGGKIPLAGTYANFPSTNDFVIPIVRHGDKWWPQGPISDKGDGWWETTVEIGTKGPDHSIYVVRAHSAGIALIRYYWKVGGMNLEVRKRMRSSLQDEALSLPWPEGPYPSVEMQSLPKGLDAEDRVDIEVT
jgi:hypothetical protein